MKNELLLKVRLKKIASRPEANKTPGVMNKIKRQINRCGLEKI